MNLLWKKYFYVENYDGNKVDVNGESMTFTLLLRKIKLINANFEFAYMYEKL